MSRSPSEVSSDAYILIMQRPDGCGFATTSNDRRYHADAMTVEPDVDLRPSELVLSEAMLGSKLSIDGELSSPALSATDMLHGRWVGASLHLLMGDWQQGSYSNLLCEGELGPVHIEAGRLSMTVDLLPSRSANLPCVQTSPECRAVLGDQQCRVDMRSRSKRVSVTAMAADGVTVNAADADRFIMGRIRWMSGARCGLEQRVIAVDGSKLALHPPEADIEISTLR